MSPASVPPDRLTQAGAFTPKLVTVLREGYSAADLKTDAVSGLTVAIVALPLSMAIAIACGAPPERGLVAAIIGGFLVSALGGSRHQIGGPAGAFIPLTASIIQVHGLDGLAIATFLAGLILLVVGGLRLGTYIKYIPYPVTVGFTAGIGVIILASQIRDLLGLKLSGPEPADFLHKIPVLWQALPTLSVATALLATSSILGILVLRRLAPRLPGFLIVVVAGTGLSFALGLGAETIGDRFGRLDAGLTFNLLPGLTIDRLRALIVPAIAIAMLGGIESLLSAVVADGMSGRRHRSNMELVAQGIANMATALFGGLPVTGAIARTATNVRSGARGPVSGMFHAVFVAIALIVAGPAMALMPLAVLGAILIVVAWNMIDWQEARALIRASHGDALVLIAAFALTVLVDLVVGIGVGIVLGALLFMHRMAEAIEIASDGAPIDDGGTEEPLVGAANRDVLVYRLSGAFFFGAAATVATVLDRIGTPPRVFVLDLSGVAFLDTTGAVTIESFADKLGRAGTQLIVSGARKSVRETLERYLGPETAIHFAGDLEQALALADRLGQPAAGLALPNTNPMPRK